jgi:hypothetical protein
VEVLAKETQEAHGSSKAKEQQEGKATMGVSSEAIGT